SLLSGSGEDSVQKRERGEIEPADRPVRFYETALLVVAGALIAFALGTQNRPATLAAIAADGLLLAVSLWKLLAPPRFSTRRCANVIVGFLFMALLLVQ